MWNIQLELAVGNQKFGSKIKIEGRCVCWITVMAELVMEFLEFKIEFLLTYCIEACSIARY